MACEPQLELTVTCSAAGNPSPGPTIPQILVAVRAGRPKAEDEDGVLQLWPNKTNESKA